MSDNVSCPLPQPITHEDARDAFRVVKTANRGLSDAAVRREAARKMGVDYDTYLAAWKKPTGGAGIVPGPNGKPLDVIKFITDPTTRKVYAEVNGQTLHRIAVRKLDAYATSPGFEWEASWHGVKHSGPTRQEVTEKMISTIRSRGFKLDAEGAAPIPTPPQPPGGSTNVLTRDAARAAEKAAAKRLGLKPGSAAARKAAAEDLGMAYDDFLQSWKGTAAKKTPSPPNVPSPIPAPKSPVIDVKPVPKQVPETVDGLTKFIGDSGLDPNDFQVVDLSGSNTVIKHIGTSPTAAAKMVKIMEDEGFLVKEIVPGLSGLWNVSRPLTRSPVGVVRKLRDVDIEEIKKLVKAHELDMPNAITRELSEQMSRVPKNAGDRFGGIQGHDAVDPTYFADPDHAGTLAYYRPVKPRTITMGKTAQTGTNFTERHLGMQKNNWFSKCDHGKVEGSAGVRNVLAHEFGHFVDDVSQIASISKRQEVLVEFAYDLGLSNAEAIEFSKGLDFTSPTLKAKITKAVSRYGATNRHEFFAEVWAEYSKAGDMARPHIKKWGTLIQDLLESVVE